MFSGNRYLHTTEYNVRKLRSCRKATIPVPTTCDAWRTAWEKHKAKWKCFSRKDFLRDISANRTPNLKVQIEEFKVKEDEEWDRTAHKEQASKQSKETLDEKIQQSLVNIIHSKVERWRLTIPPKCCHSFLSPGVEIIENCVASDEVVDKGDALLI